MFLDCIVQVDLVLVGATLLFLLFFFSCTLKSTKQLLPFSCCTSERVQQLRSLFFFDLSLKPGPFGSSRGHIIFHVQTLAVCRGAVGPCYLQTRDKFFSGKPGGETLPANTFSFPEQTYTRLVSLWAGSKLGGFRDPSLFIPHLLT